MTYLLVDPYSGENILVGDIDSAKAIAFEMGTFFFYPRKSFISTEPQKEVVIFDNGIWQTKRLKDMKCTCGQCN